MNERTVEQATDTPPPDWLRVGATAVDTRTHRDGVVMAIGLTIGGQQIGPADRVWLRPEGGGQEWTAPARQLQPAAAR